MDRRANRSATVPSGAAMRSWGRTPAARHVRARDGPPRHDARDGDALRFVAEACGAILSDTDRPRLLHVDCHGWLRQHDVKASIAPRPAPAKMPRSARGGAPPSSARCSQRRDRALEGLRCVRRRHRLHADVRALPLLRVGQAVQDRHLRCEAVRTDAARTRARRRTRPSPRCRSSVPRSTGLGLGTCRPGRFSGANIGGSKSASSIENCRAKCEATGGARPSSTVKSKNCFTIPPRVQRHS